MSERFESGSQVIEKGLLECRQLSDVPGAVAGRHLTSELPDPEPERAELMKQVRIGSPLFDDGSSLSQIGLEKSQGLAELIQIGGALQRLGKMDRRKGAFDFAD